LPVWATFQQRALDVAILEINTKTNLKIKLASTERSKHRRVVGVEPSIKTHAVARGANESVKPRSATPGALPDCVEPMQAKLVGRLNPAL